jgi:iron(III) transport system permease protein
MLFARMVVDQGRFTTAAIAKILTDRNQIRAFWNSPAAGTLVGALGTAGGLPVCIHRGARRLPRWLPRDVDASVLLPLVSPPFTTAIAIIFSFGPRGLITYELWE